VGVPDFDRGEHRHVAGTICHRRDQFDARFRAVFVGHVLSDDLGLGHLPGNDRASSLALMFLFIRGLPAISIFEMREVVHHNAGATHVHHE